MPFEDESFDIILNRHGDLAPEEFFRVLKKGGLFVTQQVGAYNDREFVKLLLPRAKLPFPDQYLQMKSEEFEKAGFECPSIHENNRKLIFENEEKGVRYFWVKPSDVAIYVERGAADIGVAGKDILLEYAPDVYELLDLNLGKCRMAVASKSDFVDDPSKTLRVATKFSNIAKVRYIERVSRITSML